MNASYSAMLLEHSLVGEKEYKLIILSGEMKSLSQPYCLVDLLFFLYRSYGSIIKVHFTSLSGMDGH